jgi:acetylglutamate kinase
VTRVIKLGGRAQNDAELPTVIKQAWDSASGNLCIVHGGGDEITALQVALGKTPEFVNGRRVTTQDDIQLLRMVLSGVINKRLVSAFSRAGIPTVGLSGEDGKLLVASRASEGEAMAELGSVGIPKVVNAQLIASLMAGSYMPVISPVACDHAESETGALNVNGDDAAAAIAAALGATELLFIADVEGVLCDGKVIASVGLNEVTGLIREGTVSGGMTAKLDAARTGLMGGVARVRISDIQGIINDQRGTTVTASHGDTR